MRTQLLIEEPTRQILPTLAVAIGLNRAIALQQLHFHLQGTRLVRGGKPWWASSIEEWREKDFPFWSAPTIDRTFDGLVTLKLVERTDMWNTKGRDRTLWYTIDYERKEELGQIIDQMKQSGSWPPVDQIDQLLLEEDIEEKEEESLILYSFTSSSVVGFFTPERVRAIFGPSESALNGRNAFTLWETAYGQLALQMPVEAFDTWLRGVRLLHHAGGVFTFDARNQYAQSWLTERLSKVIVRTLSQVAGCAVQVKFVLASEFVSGEEST
jgi:hypothetical protein